MRKKLPIIAALAGLVALSAIGLLSAGGKGGGYEMRVDVAVTNLTRGQVMSPVFIARHDRNADPLYTLGEPASGALAKMAEDADATDLLEAWGPSTNSNVGEARVVKLGDGPIPPGATVTTSLEINDGKSLLSLASMLVTTNDGFVGANGIDLAKSHTLYLAAYDAGSEANSESCEYIPGPPCGNHVEDDAESEGFVHVHTGVHGGSDSDLDPASHDWRNPVARVDIKTWKLSR